MKDYKVIYDNMKPGVWYKASDLGVAAASMTAMVKRGLVEKRLTKPMTYRRLDNSKLLSILQYARENKVEYFTLMRKNSKRGMMCSIKNNTIVDAWNKIYDITDVIAMEVYEHGLKARYIWNN